MPRNEPFKLLPHEQALIEAESNQPMRRREPPRVGTGAANAPRSLPECAPLRPQREDQGYERVAGNAIWARPTGTMRIIGLGVWLSSAASASRYVWVWDGTEVSEEPNLPPCVVAAGSFVGWEDGLKPTQFSRGVTVGISTTDLTYTQAPDVFGVFWHFMIGEG